MTNHRSLTSEKGGASISWADLWLSTSAAQLIYIINLVPWSHAFAFLDLFTSTHSLVYFSSLCCLLCMPFGKKRQIKLWGAILLYTTLNTTYSSYFSYSKIKHCFEGSSRSTSFMNLGTHWTESNLVNGKQDATLA